MVKPFISFSCNSWKVYFTAANLIMLEKLLWRMVLGKQPDVFKRCSAAGGVCQFYILWDHTAALNGSLHANKNVIILMFSNELKNNSVRYDTINHPSWYTNCMRHRQWKLLFQVRRPKSYFCFGQMLTHCSFFQFPVTPVAIPPGEFLAAHTPHTQHSEKCL